MKIGENLLELRKKAGLSRDEVGRKLGITSKTIGNYENDVSEPDFDLLERLANLYSVSVAEIFGEKKENLTVDNSLEKSDSNHVVPLFERVLEALNADGSLLNQSFDTIDPGKKDILIATMNECIKKLSKKD